MLLGYNKKQVSSFNRFFGFEFRFWKKFEFNITNDNWFIIIYHHVMTSLVLSAFISCNDCWTDMEFLPIASFDQHLAFRLSLNKSQSCLWQQAWTGIPKRTEQNLNAHIGKNWIWKVNHNKRQHSTYCTVEANYRQTRSIAQLLSCPISHQMPVLTLAYKHQHQKILIYLQQVLCQLVLLQLS